MYPGCEILGERSRLLQGRSNEQKPLTDTASSPWTIVSKISDFDHIWYLRCYSRERTGKEIGRIRSSSLFFFFLPTIPLTVGRENLSIIFLEEKKKFENRVSFLLIKEYYYSYAGTYVRSKFSFVRTPLRKFPRIQAHLNSNLLFEFGI